MRLTYKYINNFFGSNNTYSILLYSSHFHFVILNHHCTLSINHEHCSCAVSEDWPASGGRWALGVGRMAPAAAPIYHKLHTCTHIHVIIFTYECVYVWVCWHAWAVNVKIMRPWALVVGSEKWMRTNGKYYLMFK